MQRRRRTLIDQSATATKTNWRPILASVALIGLALISYLCANFALQREYEVFEVEKNNPTKIAVEYPQYLSLGETGEILIAIIGSPADTAETVQELFVQLSCHGPSPIAFDRESDSLRFKSSKWTGRNSASIKIRPMFRVQMGDHLSNGNSKKQWLGRLPWEPWGGTVELQTRVSINRQPAEKVGPKLRLEIAWLPKPRLLMTTFSSLFFSLLAWLIHKFWTANAQESVA